MFEQRTPLARYVGWCSPRDADMWRAAFKGEAYKGYVTIEVNSNIPFGLMWLRENGGPMLGPITMIDHRSLDDKHDWRCHCALQDLQQMVRKARERIEEMVYQAWKRPS